MSANRIPLGAIAKDTITGFKGIVVGRAEYLTAAAQVQLQPGLVGADGQPVAAAWFDQDRVEVGDDAEQAFGIRSFPPDPPADLPIRRGR